MPSAVVPVHRDRPDVDRRRPLRAAVAAVRRRHARRHSAWAVRPGGAAAVPCSAMVVVDRIAGGTDTASIGGTAVARDDQRIGVHSRANAVGCGCRRMRRMEDGLAFRDGRAWLTKAWD